MVPGCLAVKTEVSTTAFVVGGALGGIKEHQGRERGKQIQHSSRAFRFHSNWMDTGTSVSATCFPLEAIMKALGRTKIDYLSLDVEGAEMAVLKTIGFQGLDIQIIGVDVDSVTEREKVIRFMEDLTPSYTMVKELGVSVYSGEYNGTNLVDLIFMKDNQTMSTKKKKKQTKAVTRAPTKASTLSEGAKELQKLLSSSLEKYRKAFINIGYDQAKDVRLIADKGKNSEDWKSLVKRTGLTPRHAELLLGRLKGVPPPSPALQKIMDVVDLIRDATQTVKMRGEERFEVLEGSVISQAREIWSRGKPSVMEVPARASGHHVQGGAQMLQEEGWLVPPPPQGTQMQLVGPEKKYFAEYKQDEFVDKLLDGMQEGFFVEGGAFDGETKSNTLFLERDRDWFGVLIEPNPHLYSMCISKKRPNSYIIPGCLAVSNIVRRQELLLGGHLSGLKSEQTLDQAEKLKNAIFHNSKFGSVWGDAGQSVAATCFPLASVMGALKRERIDYLSLDMAGSELGVLKSIPWQLLDIGLVSVKVIDEEERARFNNFMTGPSVNPAVMHPNGAETFPQMYKIVGQVGKTVFFMKAPDDEGWSDGGLGAAEAPLGQKGARATPPAAAPA